MPLNYGEQRKVVIVEGKVWFNQVHRQPLADAIRGRLVPEVLEPPRAILVAGEKHVGRDANQYASPEILVVREILEREQGRGATAALRDDAPAEAQPLTPAKIANGGYGPGIRSFRWLIGGLLSAGRNRRVPVSGDRWLYGTQNN